MMMMMEGFIYTYVIKGDMEYERRTKMSLYVLHVYICLYMYTFQETIQLDFYFFFYFYKFRKKIFMQYVFSKIYMQYYMQNNQSKIVYKNKFKTKM